MDVKLESREGFLLATAAGRLLRSHETERVGVMSSLPANAVVEMRGPSDLAHNMIESFLAAPAICDLRVGSSRTATLVRTAAVGD
jgi:hypothetical protein